MPDRRAPVAVGPAALLALGAAACARATPAPAPPPFPLGGVGRAEQVAPGVRHEGLVVPARGGRGPWAVQVLRAEPAPAGCARVHALKPGVGAEGRATTSALVAEHARADSATVGGVNADFFSFAPPGVPVGAHVQHGLVVTGPGDQPVFALDSAGRPWIGVLRVVGGFVAGADTLAVQSWNRPRRDGAVVFDAGWGPRTDSVPGRVLVTFAAADGPPEPRGVPRRVRVERVDTGAVTAISPGRVVVAVGPGAPAPVRARWLALRPGAELAGAVALAPWPPAEAVGGRPVLVRAGQVATDVDTSGSAGFRGPNPRTAIGVTPGGGLILVTIDGRQPGWSAGTTLRETAELMLALGAVDALNLDGGGSTALVVRGAGGGLAVANRPSDAAGERPVGNALAVAACPAARGRRRR